MKKKLAIPTPCHENWDTMTPKEKGRHCAKCDLVVTDFTKHTTEEILETLAGATGRVCGHVREDQITLVPPEKAEFWFKYPVQRMRVFLLAFLAVFGMEIWALPEVQAADWAKFQSDLMSPAEIGKYFSDLQDEEVNIKGKVMDAEHGGGVPYATVTIWHGDQLITGVYTESDGSFHIQFESREVDYDSFTVSVRYFSNEVKQENVPPDVEEMMIFISTGVTLETVNMYLSDFNPTVDGVVLRGDLVNVACEMPQIRKWYMGTPYNPIDDYLQMRRSDVFYREGDLPR